MHLPIETIASDCKSLAWCSSTKHPQDNLMPPNKRGERGDFCAILGKNYRLEVSPIPFGGRQPCPVFFPCFFFLFFLSQYQGKPRKRQGFFSPRKPLQTQENQQKALKKNKLPPRKTPRKQKHQGEKYRQYLFFRLKQSWEGVHTRKGGTLGLREKSEKPVSANICAIH